MKIADVPNDASREALTEIASHASSVSDVTRLPDGSGFCTMSFPLPKDHWVYADHENVPPMHFRTGESPLRDLLTRQIREAGQYAVRCATMNGKDMDFDPDALLQNLVTGMLGYCTPDGLSRLGAEFNPSPVPDSPIADG